MFEPIANFAGMEHILNAVPCFVHPTIRQHVRRRD